VTTDQQSQFYVKGLGGWVHAQAQKNKFQMSSTKNKSRVKSQVQKNKFSATHICGAGSMLMHTTKNLKSQHDMAALSHDTEYLRHFFFDCGWVHAQRRALRRGELSKNLHSALVAAGFSWEGPPSKRSVPKGRCGTKK
jgi:hypothetical protein